MLKILPFDDSIHRAIQSNQLTYFIDAKATDKKEEVRCSQINLDTTIFGPNKSLSTENIKHFAEKLSELHSSLNRLPVSLPINSVLH